MPGTTALRASLVLLTLGLLGALGIVYAMGETMAAQNPEYAPLLWPVFIGIAVAGVPVLAGVVTVWQLVDIAAQPTTAFSERTVALLRRLHRLILLIAGYFAAGLVVAWVAAGDMHPSFLLIWLALEAVALFAFSLVSLLERLFRSGIEYRTDSELTV